MYFFKPFSSSYKFSASCDLFSCYKKKMTEISDPSAQKTDASKDRGKDDHFLFSFFTKTIFKFQAKP